MTDLRKMNEANWQSIKDFMTRSDLYREADRVIQKDILAEGKKTNGRISALEDFKKEIETKIQDKKDAKVNTNTLISIVTAIIMAVAAIVMCFKGVK